MLETPTLADQEARRRRTNSARLLILPLLVFFHAQRAQAAITPVGYGGVALATSFAMDIGAADANRLVVVIADNESTGTNLTGVTVDGKACTFVTTADNPNGIGNHQEMWYCDDDNLGASNGVVTVAIAGGSATWAIHAHLYTGVSQAGPTDFGIDNTSVGLTTVTVPGIDVPAGGLVVMGVGEGTEFLTVSTLTAPLALQQDGPDPSSADLFSANAIEATDQVNKSYVATLSAAHNRATGIVAAWPSLAPRFQAAGTAVTGIGAVSPVWPTHAIGDLALLFIESTGGEAATLSTPAGFAAVLNSPQSTGATTNGTRMTVFWARATSTTMATPTVADPGNHVYAQILTYRGVIGVGDPWDVTGGGVKAAASTSVTVTGVTTTVEDTLIVQAVARDPDNLNGQVFSAQTNANLTGIAERSDAGTSSGNGGGFGVWDGIWTPTGATGNTTATVTNSVNAFLTIALRPQERLPFSYRKSITIDRTQCPSGCGTTLSNFPMLYSVTDADLRTTANGGKVTNANGSDILFRALDDTTCGGAGTSPCTLDHEIESYTATTGKLVAWVRIPSLNTAAAASDTVVYIYYGNASITTPIQNAPGVWDANFTGVWHLPDGTALTAADSTSYANNGTLQSAPTATTGQIAGGASFTGAGTQYISTTNAFVAPQDFTVEAWFKTSSASGRKIVGFELNQTGTSASYDRHIWMGTDSKVHFGWYSGATNEIVSTSTLADGLWHHAVGTHTAGNVAAFYIDGVLQGTGGNAAENFTGYWRVGSFKLTGWGTTGADGYFNGQIDETRVSDVARSSCWITAQFNNQNAPGDIGAPGFYTVGGEQSSSPLTAVELISFTGTRYDRGVLLQWKTGYEIDNLGFNLYREVDGERTKVNRSLIGGSGLMAGQGTAVSSVLAYARWDLDPAATSAGVEYYLEDLDFNGTITLHGPITPTAGVLGAPEPTVAQSTDLVDLGRRGRNRKVFRSRDDDREERRDGRRKRAPVQTALDTQWALAGQPAVKIGIRAPGWYRVSQADLVAAGLDPRVDPRRLRLFVDGVEQALQVTAKAAGRFAAGDAIEFYATGIDTPYTDTRVYWLVAGAQPGRRIQLTGSGVGGRAGRSGAASFSSTVRDKERGIYFAALRNGDQENWFGALVSPEPADVGFTVDHIDRTAQGDAQLEVTLQGVTSTPDGSLIHRVGVLVNGIDVGEMTFEGQLNAVQSFAVPMDALVEGENTVTLIARGGDADYSLVDVLGLTYWHTYEADSDRLRATVGVAGPLTIGGFASSAIRVVDITDPSEVTELRGAVRTEASGFFAVTVRVSGNGPRTLLAFSDVTISSPAFVQANQPSNWHARKQANDYVAISHGDFVEQVKPLADLRTQQGYSAAVVDVEDVYDEFSFGEKTPQALKDFLQWARKTWRTVPRFVVLVGDATIDPRDYAGEGNADFVPTKQVPMIGVALETASDDWFVDFDDNGLPDVPIGRLSARTVEQAGAVVAKIVNYDESGRQPWTRNVLLVADEDGDGSSFEQYTSNLSALVPQNYTARTIFRGTLGPEATHQALIDGVNDGQLIVNFVGHGSVQLWGHDGDVLENADVTSSWRNALRLPFVVAMNCLNGLFSQIWDEESLAEALQRAPEGGAVAVWASSSTTPSATQALVNEELFRQIFEGGHATLGEAIAAAKRVVSSPDVRRSWIFFGDPAMRLSGAPQLVSAPTQLLPSAPTALANAANSADASNPPATIDVNAMLDARGEPVRLMDFNRDGSADLLLYAAGSGRWAGVFNEFEGASSVRTGSWGPGWQVLAANLNGDGRADLIFYKRDTAEWVQSFTSSHGPPVFTSGTLPGGAPGAQLRVGDFDGDGRDDLLIYDPDTGRWTVGLTDGRGGFTRQRGTWPSGLRVHVADLDGDEASDIFGYDAATGRSVLVPGGRNAHSSMTAGNWGRGWRVAVANLGGNSKADLLFYNPISGAWQTAINDGAGHFALRTGSWAPGLEIHATDLDGDRRDDVFGYNPVTGQWLTAVTRSSGKFADAVTGGAWTPGLSIATGDVNADGRGDVVLYDASSGIWFEGMTVSPGVFAFGSGSVLPGATLIGRPR